MLSIKSGVQTLKRLARLMQKNIIETTENRTTLKQDNGKQKTQKRKSSTGTNAAPRKRVLVGSSQQKNGLPCVLPLALDACVAMKLNL